MTTFSNRIAFVVPTKDRPDDLRRMLNSIEAQSVHPEEVIVVDGSKDSIEELVKEFPILRIKYVRCYPPSLAKQRNVGMAAVAPGLLWPDI